MNLLIGKSWPKFEIEAPKTLALFGRFNTPFNTYYLRQSTIIHGAKLTHPIFQMDPHIVLFIMDSQKWKQILQTHKKK
jgi:hypothetical protein